MSSPGKQEAPCATVMEQENRFEIFIELTSNPGFADTPEWAALQAHMDVCSPCESRMMGHLWIGQKLASLPDEWYAERFPATWKLILRARQMKAEGQIRPFEE